MSDLKFQWVNFFKELTSKLLKHKNSVICFMSCANISPMINEYRQLLKNNE